MQSSVDEPGVAELVDYINGLASDVERRWAALDFHESAFAEVATAALDAAPVPASATAVDALRWALSRDSLPRQADIDATFGEPPLTFFWNDRFHIDINVWRSSTTSIHQHGFCGAFCMVEGRSLQCTYRFETTDEVSERVMLGRLILDGVKVLRPGQPQTILAGPAFIHSAFHLDHPSATLVVRNHSNAVRTPQYDYRPPGLAMDPFYKPPSLRRRIQSLRALLDIGQGLEAASELLERTEFFTAVRALETIVRERGSLDRAQEFIEAIRRRHGSRVDTVLQALEEDCRGRQIQDQRDRVRDPELRFFLAALLNLRDRHSILKIVEEHFPDQAPMTRIAGWLDALAKDTTVDCQRSTVFVAKALLAGADAETAVRIAQEEAAQSGLAVSSRELRIAAFVLPHDPLLRALFARSVEPADFQQSHRNEPAGQFDSSSLVEQARHIA